MRYLHNATIKPTIIKTQEIDVINPVDPMRIPAIPKETKNELTLTIKKQIRSRKWIIQRITVKAANNNKRIRRIEYSIKRWTKNGEWRVGKSKKLKLKNLGRN